MSNFEEVQQLVSNCLEPNVKSEIRQQSEYQFNLLKQQNPDQFLRFLFVLLESSNQQNQKAFAAIQIRKNLSDLSGQNHPNLYQKISEETKCLVKTQLFDQLIKNEDQFVRKMICDAIGEIGGCFLAKNASEWPELLENVWKMFEAKNSIFADCGFKVLKKLLELASDFFSNEKTRLHELFGLAMSSDELDVVYASCSAFVTLIVSMKAKECRFYYDLHTMLLQGIVKLCEKNYKLSTECLILLGEIAEFEPKFFAKNFDLFFQTMTTIYSPNFSQDEGVKKIIVDNILTLVERMPRLIKKEHEKIKILFEMIFYFMVQIDSKISPEWGQPPEGYCEEIEDDADFQVIRFGISSIDRLFSCLGEKILLPIFSQAVNSLLQNSDWRCQYAAIMSLSQLGEYLDKISDVQPIIDIILKFTGSQNPVIRYAVCHSIGQIADDMKPDFQKSIQNDVLNALLILLDDSVSRVVAHAFSALSNYIEGMDQASLKEKISIFLQKCIFPLQNNAISIVKEAAISVIGTIAQNAAIYFDEYFQGSIFVIFDVMEKHMGKQYKNMMGLIIECISLIAGAVSRNLFLNYLDKYVNILINYQQSDFEENDPLKNKILAAWQRLVIVYYNDLVQYLPKILPSLFDLVQKMIKTNDNPEDSETSANTYANEEASTALLMLECFLSELGSNFENYSQTAMQLILPLCEQKNTNLQCSAYKCLAGLVKCVANNAGLQKDMTVYFISFLQKNIEKESDLEVLKEEIIALRDCIDESQAFLSSDQIEDIAQKAYQMMFESDRRQNEHKKEISEEEEEEEVEEIKEDIENEQELHCEIAQLYGVLFKKYKNLTLNLAEKIFSQILPNVLNEKQSTIMHKFGIFLIDDMIEHLGFGLLADKWNSFARALQLYSQSSDSETRQAASYGIGVFVQNTPIQDFSPWSEMLLKSCVDSYHIGMREDEDEKRYLKAQDNAVSAIGKFLRFQNESINYQQTLEGWLKMMPIKKDKEEALIQHEFLSDLILKNPSIFDQNQQNIHDVLRVFSEIIGTKYINSEIYEKIGKNLKIFGDNWYVKENWKNIMKQQNLSQQQEGKLQKCGAQAFQ